MLGAWQRNKDAILGEEALRTGPAMPSAKISPPTLRGQNPVAGFTLANVSHRAFSGHHKHAIRRFSSFH
jgi:hypothetical protein